MPAKNAATIPDTKLGGEKNAEKNSPIIPPKVVDNTPNFAPRIIPIIGAVMVAIVMALLGKPTIGKAGQKQKSVYNAVKHIVKATSFAVDLLSFRMPYNQSSFRTLVNNVVGYFSCSVWFTNRNAGSVNLKI